jgi:hypothetical protein
MKQVALLFITMLLLNNSYSQSTAAGYYITQKNDTVVAQIKLRKGIFGQSLHISLKEVEVVDSLYKETTFKPEDIKGYGFLQKGVYVRLVSKPIKDGSYKFLYPVVTGPKTSLYQYSESIAGSGTNFAQSKVFYTFEKADGTYLFLRNMLNKKFKSELKAFYSGNTAVQELIDTKLKYWLDMQADLVEIMKAANKP